MKPVRHAHAKAPLGTRRAGRSALGMLLAVLLLSGSATTPAAAAEPAGSQAPAAAVKPTASPTPATSFKELAASCGPSTLKSVLIGGASGVDDQLYGARKEDAARIKKVCGMVQAFAKKGKPVKAFDSTPYSFFYGLSLTFSNKGDASIFGSTGGLYLESGSTFLQLDDISVSKDYSSLFVRNEEIAEIPATARFGEKIRLKGHDPLLFSPELFVYWTPNAETYSSSSDSSGYPYDHSLLIGTGTQQFGYYDFSITLPAYGKAKDGTMKFLESKGSLSLYVAYGGNGSRTLGEMSLLPAAEPFLSVDGKPALDAALRPILREGRALLPLRSIAKLAGKSVVWDKASWSALIRSEPPAPRKGAYSFPQLWIDGKLAAPELQPILRDGLTYVPIRALTAAFGISVSWNAASRSVDIELP